MAASLIMASVRASLRVLATDLEVVAAVEALNQRLSEELAPREFVALALAYFDPMTRELELANCGLPDPYRLGLNGGQTMLPVPGPRLPLGIRQNTRYETARYTLEQGERILMITDGLPEAVCATGEPLGYEAFERCLDHDHQAPLAWLGELVERVTARTEPTDDLTALLLEVAPSPAFAS